MAGVQPYPARASVRGRSNLKTVHWTVFPRQGAGRFSPPLVFPCPNPHLDATGSAPQTQRPAPDVLRARPAPLAAFPAQTGSATCPRKRTKATKRPRSQRKRPPRSWPRRILAKPRMAPPSQARRSNSPPAARPHARLFAPLVTCDLSAPAWPMV